MNISNILGLALLSEGAIDAHTVNRALMTMEAAIAGEVILNLDATADVVLSSLTEEVHTPTVVPVENHYMIVVNETDTASTRNLIFTPTIKGTHAIKNNTGGGIVCRYPTGDAALIDEGDTGHIYCNGSNVIPL